ncbi:MAG: hypothetical protein QXG00_06455 [Candidatus Woesearchaeota archaeon]
MANFKSHYTDGIDFSESGNWNVASQFAETMIMAWMKKVDEYLEVAEFGASSLMEDFQITDDIKKQARILALRRAVSSLLFVIENTTFASKSNDQDMLNEFEANLYILKKIIPAVQINLINQKEKTKTIKIDEEKFEFILNTVRNIKKRMYYPLNNAELIFQKRNEYDWKELKQKLIEDISEGG